MTLDTVSSAGISIGPPSSALRNAESAHMSLEGRFRVSEKKSREHAWKVPPGAEGIVLTEGAVS